MSRKVAKMLVRNRSVGHYVLSVYSLLFRGYCVDDKNDIITLIAPSRSIGRTTDLANMLARVCAPGLLWLSPKRTKISNRLQKGDVYPKVSNLIVKLTSFNRKHPSGDTIDQSKEIEKAFNNYNDRRKQKHEPPISKAEYTVIEAITSYREEHPGASLGEFEAALGDIQNEFFDKIVKAIPSDQAEGGKPGEPQKFNICELEFILSTLLKKGCELFISCPDEMNIELKWSADERKKFVEANPTLPPNKIKGKDIELGKVFLDNMNIKYKPLLKSLPVTAETCHYVKSSIEAALMRMGLLRSPQLDELAKDMCRFDDILVGLDTSCFYHGVVTGALLDSFVGVARYPYLDTPNWITLVASVISTGEIEHKANTSKDYFDDKDTQDTHNRRTAFRALQEFMEMSTCADLEGVATLLTGEISPDIDFSGDNTIRDELIRKQIKNFLSNIGFHTGTYFLTGDRKCAMFARAEGLHAVHLKRKPLDTTKDIPLTDLSPQNYGDDVSELVYELGIEFPLKITCKGENREFPGLSFIVRTDWPGKSLEEWENCNFMVKFVEDGENMYNQFYDCLEKNAKAVELGQLLWGWKQVNARHHEEPGYPGWAT